MQTLSPAALKELAVAARASILSTRIVQRSSLELLALMKRSPFGLKRRGESARVGLLERVETTRSSLKCLLVARLQPCSGWRGCRCRARRWCGVDSSVHSNERAGVAADCRALSCLRCCCCWYAPRSYSVDRAKRPLSSLPAEIPWASYTHLFQPPVWVVQQ